jgi:hypothetical protein
MREYNNERVSTCHKLYDSVDQLTVTSISSLDCVLRIGKPEFMTVFMDKSVATDLMEQIVTAIYEMKEG